MKCFLNWQDIRGMVGPCLRPGGIALTEKALKTCNLSDGSKIVDIGCGAGKTIELVGRTGEYQVIGFDYSEELLREAMLVFQPRPLVRGRAEILPFKNNTFHALFCECVLSTLSDKLATVTEFARVLKEGGFLIVSDVFDEGQPCIDQIVARHDGIPAGKLLTKSSLLNTLAGFGFSFLLWEEHKQLFKEFVAQMILAGVYLPNLWECTQGHGKKPDRARISYFLLVARKTGNAVQPNKIEGEIDRG